MQEGPCASILGIVIMVLAKDSLFETLGPLGKNLPNRFGL